MKDNLEIASKLWSDYENGIQYQNNLGIRKNIPKYVDYFEGRQWATPTKDTKNLPRPVINIIKLICRNKKSAILSATPKTIYKTYDDVDIEKFNHYAEYQQHSMKNEKKNAQATFDAVKKGNWIKHYYWDKEARGKNGKVTGALDCEVIDPLHIFVSNPTESDIQKQEWVIIEKREPISSVKAKCDNKQMASLITPDDCESNAYDVKEQDGTELVTCLTRYFRKNGSVWCEVGTKNGMVKEAWDTTPNVDLALEQLRATPSNEDKILTEEMDAPNNNIIDKADDNELISDNIRAFFYPIAWESYEQREGSIYGIGEIESLKPNQDIINFTTGMSVLNIQENAWGKYIVLPNALRQKITNRVGEVITDWSGTGNGIRKMTEQVLQSQPMALVESIIQNTRAMTGATEVLSGEVLGKNMSGSAIATLQNQAQAPVEELRDNFWRFLEQEGKILAQFYKLYYTNENFAYENENKEIVNDSFSSEDYRNADFEVAVEIISGAKSSVVGDTSMLDNLLQSGSIDAKTYITLYPDCAISNKNQILKELDRKEQSELQVMSQQSQQLAQQLQEATNLISKQQEVVDKVASIIKENDALKVQLAELYTQASDSINQANQEIASGNEMMQKLLQDDKNKALFESLQDNKAMAEYINKNRIE